MIWRARKEDKEKDTKTGQERKNNRKDNLKRRTARQEKEVK